MSIHLNPNHNKEQLRQTEMQIDKRVKFIKTALVIAAALLMLVLFIVGVPLDSLPEDPDNYGTEAQRAEMFEPVEGAVSTVAEEAEVHAYVQEGDMYRITHYGPPRFPLTNNVARGNTVEYWIDMAITAGLDGICAVSPGTPWYDKVRDDLPPVLWVRGHGCYLAVDRTARRIQGTVDIYEPGQNGHDLYAHNRNVFEVAR